VSAQAATVGTGCRVGSGAQADGSSLGRRSTSVVPLRWPATPAPRSFLAALEGPVRRRPLARRM